MSGLRTGRGPRERAERLDRGADQEAGEQVAPVRRRGGLEHARARALDQQRKRAHGREADHHGDATTPHLHLHGIGNSAPQLEPLEGVTGRSCRRNGRWHVASATRLPKSSDRRHRSSEQWGRVNDRRAARAEGVRVPAHAGPGTRVARRGGGVPARPRLADPHGRQRAAEPVRRLSRGAVRAVEPRVRPVAADEVPVVRRARRARLRDPVRAPREEPARLAGGRAPARPALPRRARAARRRSATAAPRGGRAVGARRSAAGARARAEGAEAPAGPLERCGALVSRSIVYEEPHRHTSLLSRWDQVYPEPAAGGGLAELVVRAVQAAVLAPEAEVSRWFAWSEDGLADRLVEEGQLVRPEPGWLAAS